MPTKYTYSKVIYNNSLGLSKEIKAETSWDLNKKIKEQQVKWHGQEERKREKQRNENLRYKAEHDTKAALFKIGEYRNILLDALNLDSSIDINSLKKTVELKEFEFKEEPPSIEEINVELDVPKKSIVLEFFFKSIEDKRIKLENDAKNLFEIRIKEYNDKKAEARKKYDDKRLKFDDKIKSFNATIDKFKNDLVNCEEHAIEKYINLVLEKSKYPFKMKKQFEIQYDSLSQVLIISYELPTKNIIPSIIEHRYIATRKEIDPINMKPKEFNQYYEDILYKVCLRNVYEVYESLKIDSLKTVIFNGWIKGIDPKTGNDYHACIMSLQASREEFSKLNLKRVNPKECFKNLKGISAGPLSELAPIKPILDLNRNDSRFVTPREVLDKLDDGTNLAEMDWEDFEHLVRELFEKIFTGENCEVKVTQASRDCGVDAIAFDPDPIRGGKFVIQAKRYNNVVPTSAIRDLYGTMTAERANKGILVTTSKFGSDSVQFAKDKPITLIDGGMLLYMFKNHGYNLNIKLRKKKFNV